MSTLNSCSLTGNTADCGGGVLGGTLNAWTLTSNSARTTGGGVGAGIIGLFSSGASLNNCLLRGNSATYGGGAGFIFGGMPYLSAPAQHRHQSGNSTGRPGSGKAAKDADSPSELTLNDCVLTNNMASDSGGGAFGGRLNNCILAGNSATISGGGAGQAILNNCTLTGNSAMNLGGGAGYGTLNNCIVYFNTATDGANYFGFDWAPIALNYCCSTPMPTNGVGNITNAPLFVDYAGGNLRLQSNSPCINAGLSAYAPGPTDMDGRPRIVSGTVDIGAYEFQGSGSVISYARLQRYGLPTDGSADFADPDRDGLNTWQEWRCLTDPTNALSVLRLLSASRAGSNVTVTWQSVAGVSYFLERSTNLTASPPFSLLATNLAGQANTTSFADTNAAAAHRAFYRVGVFQ